MWRSLSCPTHGAIMHRVEPNGDTTCLQCLSDKVTKASRLGLSGEVHGIANGVFLLSEDGGRAMGAEIRNALQPVAVVCDQLTGEIASVSPSIQAEFLEGVIARFRALADAFDGK